MAKSIKGGNANGEYPLWGIPDVGKIITVNADVIIFPGATGNRSGRNKRFTS